MSRGERIVRASDGTAGRGEPSSDYAGRGGVELAGLAEKLAELSRTLQDELDVDATLRAVVQAATDTVPGAEFASITVVIRRRDVETRAATGELPRAVDQAQYRTGEGPCLDSLYERRTVRLSDLRTEQRWPAFAAEAADLGVGSMLAVQLYVQGEDLGALNLHSSKPGAFDDESEQVALLFAAHAAVAMAGAQDHEHMQTALDTRDTIGMAKGILIERYKTTPHEAFRLLVVASQASNVRLAEVADFLVRTGHLASRKP